jgi:formyltetrahydrofolate synthetase
MGIRKNRSIHRIMCETFLLNPENKAHVNHIDGNKLNNILTNLEWATEKENSQHAVDTGLTTHDHCVKEVHQYTYPEKVFIQSFFSDAEAERVTRIAKQNISKVTLGLRNHAGKFFWSRNKI